MASTFTVEDVRLLEKTISIRERIIDNYLTRADGLPTAPRDMEAFTNVLESVDRSIFSKAKINIEENSAKVDEATKGVLRDLMLSLHKRTSSDARASNHIEIPVFNPTGMEILEGELVPKIDHQDVNQFLEIQQSE